MRRPLANWEVAGRAEGRMNEKRGAAQGEREGRGDVVEKVEGMVGRWFQKANRIDVMGKGRNGEQPKIKNRGCRIQYFSSPDVQKLRS